MVELPEKALGQIGTLNGAQGLKEAQHEDGEWMIEPLNWETNGNLELWLLAAGDNSVTVDLRNEKVDEFFQMRLRGSGLLTKTIQGT